MDFTSWALQKKLKDQDLLFKRALKTPLQEALFSKLANQLASLNPTYSEGLSVLEMLTDLILMGHNEMLFEGAESFETWKSALKKLRFPETSQRDELLKTKLEQLPWPYGSKVKFERRGDKAGVELKLFVSSATDLTKILASLERVQVEISK
ncbi:MAG: hypothetical protein H7061_11895 [Bdellovibrionaceae bacterium]|nr:hypothetical protein [Bdellovibrio sp.]